MNYFIVNLQFRSKIHLIFVLFIDFKLLHIYANSWNLKPSKKVISWVYRSGKTFYYRWKPTIEEMIPFEGGCNNCVAIVAIVAAAAAAVGVIISYNRNNISNCINNCVLPGTYIVFLFGAT